MVDLASTATQTYHSSAHTLTLTSSTGIEDIVGSARGDTLKGNGRANELDGQAGDDFLFGEGANDTLIGGTGNDTMTGGPGYDTYAFAGKNLGSDTIDEAANADTDTLDFTAFQFTTSGEGVTLDLASTYSQYYHGTSHKLTLSSSSGIENVTGTARGDVLKGNGRVNDLRGNGGDDELYGRDSTDTLRGGAGKDTLDGGEGDDLLEGEGEDDTLKGGSGVDTMLGGAGDDVLEGGDQGDWMWGGSDDDSLDGEDGDDTLFGDGENDLLKGGGGVDTIYGGSGNDVLEGGEDGDTLHGQDGDDTLRGEAGIDTLFGGLNNDNLYGGADDDTLYGGSDNDGLFGGGGNDTLYGGLGNDRFLYQFGDNITDKASNDARIPFFNGSTQTFNNEGRETTLTAGTWTDADIERVDTALMLLHHRTGNTTLLKKADGGEVLFRRFDEGPRGFNTDGMISLVSWVFADPRDHYLETYVLHEIGHNWDEESPIADDFLDVSGWTGLHPMILLGSDWEDHYTRIDRYGDTLYFLTDSEFASTYAKTHPHDDFAESFAAYFAQLAGWDTAGWSEDGINPDSIPQKLSLIDSWLNTID